MELRGISFVFGLVVLLVVNTAEALAHPQKNAIATVTVNERTHAIEVVHRFSQHDAEHVAQEVSGGNVSIRLSEEAQAQFADYVVETFSMRTLEGEMIALNTVGYEFDDGYIWIYQEAPIIEGLMGVSLRYDALQDIWPEQVNLVNVEVSGEVQSVYFTDVTTRHDIVFKQPKTD